jgi:hypothetical protein
MEFSNFNRSVNPSIRTTLITSSLIAASLISGAAHAALQGRDLNGSAGSFEAYYDTDLDITWLADANYAKTSGYDADGMMTWADANTWVANLSLTDTVNNITYDNWRLPTVTPVNGVSFVYSLANNGSTDYGYNISAPGSAYPGSTGSEMAHLYYNTLSNKSFACTNCSTPQAGWGLTNTGPFTNLQDDHYWSATVYAPDTGSAWVIYFGSIGNAAGGQGYRSKNHNAIYALAVSPGDVAAVPEAQTYAMMLASLGLVGFAARRRSM